MIAFYHRASSIGLVFFTLLMLQTSAVAQKCYQEDFRKKLVAAAVERTEHYVMYDGSYRRIGYPGGDVPDDRGVCTDVIIRSYRAVGVDLQLEVHEDMSSYFQVYPQQWGHTKPDANIDHRRVLNLRTFFNRQGWSLIVSDRAGDYKAGDIVTCVVPPRLAHMMIVSDRKNGDGRPLVIHNIGAGVQEEDRLFEFQLTGHYRITEIVRHRSADSR